MKFILVIKAMLLGVLLAGCVTTTTGPFSEKRDLDQAVETYTQIGYRHFERDNLFEAKRALNQALEIDRRASGAHLGLARVYEVEREFELADRHFRDAIRFNGGTEARFQYAVYLYNQREFDDAMSQFQIVTQDTFFERRAMSFEFQALTARRLDNIDLAISSYERALVLDRMLPNSYLGLSELLRQREQNAEAYRAYRGFVSLVQARRAEQNASSLWLGIRLAHAMSDEDLMSSLELQLRNRFPDSDQFRQYQAWRQQLGRS